MKSGMTIDLWKRNLKEFERGTDAYLSEEMLRRGRLLLERFVEFSDARGDVLDIGCGSGDFGRLSKAGGYIGIDPIASGPRDFRFVQGVGERLPFEDGSFDSIVTMAALDHSLDPEQIMNESSRVLKSSGRIYIWMPVTRSDLGYKIRRMMDYLKSLDFRSLYRSAKANINVFIGGEVGPAEYWHTYRYTENSLVDMVSRHFGILGKELHGQDVFIAAQK